MRKIVNLNIILTMSETEFEFKSQDEAREFATLMQKSAIKNMKKVLDLPEGTTDENPVVPGFEIIGTPEGSEQGFLLGEIPASIKGRKAKVVETENEAPEIEETDEQETEEVPPQTQAPAKTKVNVKRK